MYKSKIKSKNFNVQSNLKRFLFILLFISTFVIFPSTKQYVYAAPSLDVATKLENFSHLNNRQIIPEDPGYIYIVNSRSIYRYDFINDTELEEIFESGYKGSQTSYFINKNMIYIQIQESAEATKTHIDGFDIKTKSLIYQNDFPIENESDRRQQFVVDDNQNFYFKEGNRTIKLYDKNAVLKDTMTDDTRSTNMELVRVSANQNVLFHNNGYIYIKDGTFIDGRAYYDSYTDEYNVYSSDTVYAVGRYGGVYKYIYGENKVTVTDIFHSLKGYGKLSDTTAFFYDNKIFLEGKDNKFLVYDINSNKVTNILNFESDISTTINYVSVVNGKLYLIYKDYYGDQYRYEIDVSQIPKIQNRLLTEHITYSHTKEQIINKFNEAKPRFDYSNSVFLKEPSTVAPYYEGELQEQVKTDTLNQINFYRWQVGLKDVSLSTNEEMQNSQKGALLMKVNNNFSHFQSKPQDMDSEFYQKAAQACYGNIAYNSSLINSVPLYINDLNSNPPTVGHRLSILSKNANTASMGYCSPYSTIYMHEDLQNTFGNNEDFYAFPTPGYMLADEIDKDAWWTISLADEFDCLDLSKAKITITVNNKTYNVSGRYEDSLKVFYYSLPTELETVLTGDSNKFLANIPITIEVIGIVDEQYNDVTIKYQTEFIYAEDKLIDNVRICEGSSVNSGFLTVISEGDTVELDDINDTCALFIDPIPSDATDTRYTIEVEDPTVLSVERNTTVDSWYRVFEITPLKEGVTNIIIKRTSDGKVIRTQEIQIGEPFLKGDMDKNKKITPYDAFLINVMYEEGRTPTAEELQIGDIDENGKLTPYDAFLINVAYENGTNLE